MIKPAFPELFSTRGDFIIPVKRHSYLPESKKKSICLEIAPQTNSEKILFSVFCGTLLHVSESLRTSIELGDQRTHYTSFPLSVSAQCYTRTMHNAKCTMLHTHTLYIIAIVCFCTMQLYKAIIFTTIATNSPRKSLQYLRGAIYVQCKPCKLF